MGEWAENVTEDDILLFLQSMDELPISSVFKKAGKVQNRLDMNSINNLYTAPKFKVDFTPPTRNYLPYRQKLEQTKKIDTQVDYLSGNPTEESVEELDIPSFHVLLVDKKTKEKR